MMIHEDFTPEIWLKFSLLEQLTNIGTEIERTISSKKKGARGEIQENFFRALEFIDFTRADPKNKQRLKELCYARYFMVDHFAYDNEYGTTDEYWSELFRNRCITDFARRSLELREDALRMKERRLGTTMRTPLR